MLSIIISFTACASFAVNYSATMTIKAVDEVGGHIPGASVMISFEYDDIGGRTIVHEGYTDTNGIYSATEATSGYILVRINKDGYYNSQHRFKWHGHKDVSGEFPASGMTNEIVLRAKSNPIPMYARAIRKIIPADDTYIGFDMVKSDWVHPYGTGQYSDLEFMVTRSFTDVNNFSASLSIQFNELDGIRMMANPIFPDSEFKGPRHAPVDAYENSTRLNFARVNGRTPGGLYNEPNNYYFRIRSKQARDGIPETALYGKIMGGINFGGVQSEHAAVWFTYYLNPHPNDTNLEFDPGHNLFPDITDDEVVREP